MTKLAILEYPDPRLRQRAEPVTVVDDAVRQLAADMLETMYWANGVGLAATQVDVHLRLIVLDISESRDQPLVLINPELLMAEGKGPGEEGCLSVPGIYDKLSRATHIKVRALNLQGESVQTEAEGLHSHQIDFFLEQPTRVVFAESGRLYQGRGFIGIGVRGQRVFRRWEHQILDKKRRNSNTPTPENRKALRS